MCRRRKKSIDYTGMTVNERLYLSGYLYKFEDFIKNNQIEQATNLLISLDISEKNAYLIVKELQMSQAQIKKQK